MISGIVNKDLYKLVNLLPFVDKSDEELINIMSMLWDKWIEFSNDNSPKPEWLITAEDTEYIELDDIVL